MLARHLVLGLDGADVDLLDDLGPSVCPTLHALCARGAWARLESVVPCATLPNWATFLTGADPGAHGVFDFTTRSGTRVAFTGGTIRAVPTLAARLDRLGLRTATVGFPGTFPPERLAHGVMVSGWDAPVDMEASREHVWPPSLHTWLARRRLAIMGDDDEFAADRPGWHAQLADTLIERIEARTHLAEAMLREGTRLVGGSWDLFAFYFGESDTAAHHLVSLWDTESPRHPSNASERERTGLPRVYAALDRAVARLLEVAGGDSVELTLVSDHGSGPASDKVLHLNTVLAEAGWLTFRPTSPTLDLLGEARALGMRWVPPRLKARLFHALGRSLPGWLESQNRFGCIDFARTRAFSDELNYFPAIHLNRSDREPHGTIPPGDLPRALRELEDLLLALRDPWTGAPVVEAVWPREALYAGPHLDRAPDVILELHLDRETRASGATYNLMPSRPGTRAFRRMTPSEYRGRKGRSLPGSHRKRGFFCAVGPSIRPVGELDAHIADAAATLIARMGHVPPAELSGRVLRSILVRSADSASVLPGVARGLEAPHELAHTEARLRALGYVD